MADDRSGLATLSPARRSLIALRIARRELGAPAPMARLARDGGPLPLSFGQQRLFVLDQIDPGSSAYNVPTAFRLSGAIDVAALRRALDEILRRHEVLRSTIELVEDRPVARIHAPAPFPLELESVEEIPPGGQERAAQALCDGEAARPFDLARGPLARGLLVRLGPTEHRLVLTLHHAVADGWSQGVLIRELSLLYQAQLTGRDSGLAEQVLQYADFAAWQRSELAENRLARDLAYWTQRLAGATAVELPTDHARPAEQSHRGARIAFRWPGALVDSLKELARGRSATLYMTLLAAFDVVLHRYTGQDDVVVGSVIANRRRAELEPMIGFFVNTLALRTDLSGDPTFVELLARVRDAALGAQSHQDLPFERLVEALAPPRDQSRHPLFQHVLVLQNWPLPRLLLPGVDARPLDVESGGAQFDLAVSLRETADGLSGSVEYATDLFDEGTIRRLVDNFETALRGAVASPYRRISELPAVSPREAAQIAVFGAARAPTAPALPLHRRFEMRARETPLAAAVCYEDRTLDYGALNRRANRLAHRLREHGVGPDVLVGLCVDRSLDLVVGILGILKAGGAYVPLDPGYPADRLAFMVEDAALSVVVTHAAAATALPPGTAAARVMIEDLADERREHDPEPLAGPEHVAYVIYTSGSTGKPKGVLVTHANIARLMDATDPWFRFGPSDVWTLFHSFAFDFSVWELWGALAYGGRLVVVPYWVSRSPEAFVELLRKERVTVLNQTPSAFRPLIHAEAASGAPGDLDLRLVIFGGEALDLGSLRPWFARHGDERPRLVNMYGITETTVHVTYRPIRVADVEAGLGSVIGVPIPDLSVCVLDQRGRIVPIGAAGELYVGGAGVARGYLSRPELTRQRFVADPGDPAAHLYRSGDLVRYLAGGDLEYLGRIDDQVKIRGFRIELGEIEAVLGAHPAVHEVAVIAREDTPGDRRLVAYVVATESEGLVEELRAVAHARLPDYMVPAAFVHLDRLPLTHNGKIDRRALPKPDLHRAAPSAGAEPRTAGETALVAIWQEVLGVPRVGIHDGFFDLGGDSILSIQVVARARQAGLVLTPRQLFKTPTIAELAAAATSSGDAHARDLARAVDGDVPLTPIQSWFFEQGLEDAAHWNQSFALEVPAGIDPAGLERALARAVEHHDVFRLRFTRGDRGWTQRYGDVTAPKLARADLRGLGEAERAPAIAALGADVQLRFDLAHGPLVAATYVDLGPDEPGRLLLAIHHLVVDGVSWRILLEDVEAAYAGRALPAKTASFGEWSERLLAHAASASVAAEAAYWTQACRGARTALLAADDPSGDDLERTAASVRIVLDAAETLDLVQRAPAAYGARAEDVLLTALAMALDGTRGGAPILVDVEGHGRDVLGDVDVSRTVGWFTTISPLALRLPADDDLGAAVKAVKEQIRAVPGRGASYGLLRHGPGESPSRAALAALPQAEVVFNYLGAFDRGVCGSTLFRFAKEPCGPWHAPRARRRHAIEVLCQIRDGCLEATWIYGGARYARATVAAAAARFERALHDVIAHCAQRRARASTPSDFPLALLSQDAIDGLERSHGELDDAYPLSAMQRLFHSMEGSGTGIGFEQWRFELRGAVDPARLRAAWRQVVDRHPMLRTIFVAGAGRGPLQVVVRRVDLPWTEHDLRELSAEARSARLTSLLEEDRRAGFALDRAPLLRIALVRLADDLWQMVWSTHHLLVDGWSWPLVLRDLAASYRGDAAALAAKPCPYGRYVEWLASRSPADAERYWRHVLAGYTEPTPIPGQAPHAVRAEDWIGEVEDHLPAPTVAALREVARKRHLTLSTLTQGAWALVLAHHAARTEVVFGITVSGRPVEVPGIEGMVGPCVSNVPMRVRIEPALPAHAWLAALQGQQLESTAHAHGSTEDLQAWSELPPRHRLFDSLLVFQNYVVDPAASRFGDGLAIALLAAPEATNYPVTLMAFPGTELRLKLLHHRSRLDADDARATLIEVHRLLEVLAERPEITVAAWQGTLAAATRGTARAAATPAASGPPPRTDLERRLAKLWGELFEVERVGVDTSFFDLGGHSLLLLKLHARLAGIIGHDTPIVTLFQYPTISLLARHLSEGPTRGPTQTEFAERARRQRQAMPRPPRAPSRA